MFTAVVGLAPFRHEMHSDDFLVPPTMLSLVTCLTRLNSSTALTYHNFWLVVCADFPFGRPLSQLDCCSL